MAQVTCINITPEQVARNLQFCKEVVEKLTPEQKEEYGITTPELESDAAETLLIIAEKKFSSMPGEESDRLLSDHKAFINWLENNMLKTPVGKDYLESSTEAFNQLIAINEENGMPSRIGVIEYDNNEEYQDAKENYWKHIKENPLSYVVEDDKNFKIYYSLRKPVPTQQMSSQDLTLAQIDYVTDPSNIKKTKFNEYKYFGQTLTATGVTRITNKTEYLGPIAAGPIGTGADTVGRAVFADPDRLTNATPKQLEELNKEAENLFSIDGLKNLIGDFRELETILKKKFGEDIKFVTKKMKFIAQSEDGSWVVGEPDMLIVDGKGQIHVLDFKTSLMKAIGDGSYASTFTDKDSRLVNYAAQLRYYIDILRSLGFNVADEPFVVSIDAYYESSDVIQAQYPNQKTAQQPAKGVYKGNVFTTTSKWIGNENVQTIGFTSPIKVGGKEASTLGEYAAAKQYERSILGTDTNEKILYIEPRLHVKTETRNEVDYLTSELDALKPASLKDKKSIGTFKDQSKYLTPEEMKNLRSLGVYDFGREVGNIKKLSQTDIESRPDIITREEIRALSEDLMYTVASVISDIQEGTDVIWIKNIPTTKLSSYKGMKRDEISRRIGINTILDEIFSRKYTSLIHRKRKGAKIIERTQRPKSLAEFKTLYGKVGCDTDEELKERWELEDWLDRHKEQFYIAGARKLMELESYVVPRLVAKDTTQKSDTPEASAETSSFDVEEDTGNNELVYEYQDNAIDGLSEKEAWMFNARNISAKSSLSKEVRRMLANISYVDDNGDTTGEPILQRRSKFKAYNAHRYVDTSKAAQAILKLTCRCETIEQMINVLDENSHTPGNQWMHEVVEMLVKPENKQLKAKFFRNFRKDFIIYTISEPVFDKRTGKRYVRSRVINLSSARESMMASLENNYREGKVGRFDFRGRSLGNSLGKDKNNKSRLPHLDDNDEGMVIPMLERNSEGKGVVTKINGISSTKYLQEYADRWNNLIKAAYESISTRVKDSSFKPEEGKTLSDSKKELIKDAITKTRFVKSGLSLTEDNENGITVVQALTDLLNGAGIFVNEKVVEQTLLDHYGSYTGSNAEKIISLVKDVFTQAESKKAGQHSLTTIAKEGEASNNVAGPQISLIDMLAENVQQVMESSCYNDGKTYYSFVNPSILGSIIRNLQNATGNEDDFREFYDFNYGRYSQFEPIYTTNYGTAPVTMCSWLNYANSGHNGQLTADVAKVREGFAHKSELSYIGNDYADLSPLTFMLSILHNHFGSKADQTNGFRYYALPTMSNKPVNEYIRVYDKINSLDNEPTFYAHLLLKEVHRISDVLEHFADGKAPTKDFDLTEKSLKKAGYQASEINGLKDRIRKREITADDVRKLANSKSGAKFHFLWYLTEKVKQNDETANRLADDLAFIYNSSFTENTDLSLEDDYFKVRYGEYAKRVEAIEQELREQTVEDELEYLKKIGMFETTVKKGKAGGNVTSFKYQEEFEGMLGSDVLSQSEIEEKGIDQIIEESKLREKLKEFIRKDMMANMNIIMITATDPAFFRDSVNYQKRIAQLHSSGTKLINDPEICDGFMRSVHIKDTKIRKEIVPLVEYSLENFMENNIQKEHWEDYKKMIKLIVAGVDDAYVSDGQSYNSPSSIRKKLRLMGEFDDEAEEAYQRVLEGDFSINNIRKLMWGPEKPFLTANVARYSGSRHARFRKVPIQDKSSEYLIILADAIIQGGGHKNKMKAIYDFMEATHKYGDGRHGIDTVHFDSASKEGTGSVIDIDEFDKTFEKDLANGKVTEADYNKRLTEFMLDKINSNPPSSDMVGPGKLKPEEAYYNNDYVDTFPVENYIIQQEVPSHELGNEMLSGSQNRALVISDITPGTIFTIRSKVQKDGNTVTENQEMDSDTLIQEYQQLYADNIKDTYEDLLKELGYNEMLEDKTLTSYLIELPDKSELKDKVYTRLSNLLRKELFKDNSYNLDLRRACELLYDDSGHVADFKIPLSEPIQASRIEALIHSIIKNRINKQGTKGMPLVQTTVFDRNLHIRFKDSEGNELPLIDLEGLKEDSDEYKKRVKEYKQMLKDKKASIAYFEAYAPILDPVLQKLLTNPDGTMMSVEEAKKVVPKDVWEEITKMIGYRIPTEDKYSMMPIKVVGFMPYVSGQAIMLPEEITFLTGSDFDIDKLYCMIKSFEYKVPKGTADELIEKYKASGGLYFQGIEGIAERLLTGTKSLFEGNETEDLESIAKGVGNVYDADGLKHFVSWYRKNLLKNVFTEYSDRESKSSRVRRNSRNNRIFDIEWAVLTHEDTLPKQMNAGNFNTQKKVGRMITIVKSGKINPETEEAYTWNELSSLSIDELDDILNAGETHSVTLTSSKIYFQQQNMQGAKLVGIFANANVSHIFGSMLRIGIDLDKNARGQYFFLGDRTIGDPVNIVRFDAQIGFDGQYISKTIASFLAASVDTAKDPTLASMNVNTFTADIAMVLARLGYDTETIGLLLSQPIVERLSEIYFLKNNDGYFSKESAVNEIANELGLDNDTLYEMGDVQNGLSEDALTKKNLIEHLTDNPNALNNDFQINVLKVFNGLVKMAGDVQKFTYVTKFNSVKNSGGPSISDSQYSNDRVEEFFDSIETSCFYIPNRTTSRDWDRVEQIFDKNPILDAFYKYTLDNRKGLVGILFNPFFNHYLEGFKAVREKVKNEVLNGGKIDAKLNNQLLNAYVYYLLTLQGEYNGVEYKPTLPSSYSDKKALVVDLLDLYDEVKKMKDRPYNMLLDEDFNFLYKRASDQFLGIPTLAFHRSGMDTEHQEMCTDAWTELIQMNDPNLSSEANKKIRRFAVDLFFYSLMRAGFTFSPKTITSLASTIVKFNATYDRKKFNNYVSGIRHDYLTELDAIVHSDDVLLDRFIEQFVRNNSTNPKLSVKVRNDDTRVSPDENDENRIMIAVSEDELNLLYPFVTDSNYSQARPYLTVMGGVELQTGTHAFTTSLYKVVKGPNQQSGVYTVTNKDGSTDWIIEYERISELGVKYNFIEYDANASEDGKDEEHNLAVSFFQNAQGYDEEYTDSDPDSPETRRNDPEENNEQPDRTRERSEFLRNRALPIARMIAEGNGSLQNSVKNGIMSAFDKKENSALLELVKAFDMDAAKSGSREAKDTLEKIAEMCKS